MNQDTQDRQWQLNDLYRSADDPALAADLAMAQEQADRFRHDWRQRIADPALTAGCLTSALVAYEALQRFILRPYHYATLLFAADGNSPVHRALMAKVRETMSTVTEATLFFELELVRLDADQCRKLLARDVLAPYRHWLENLLLQAPYTLSEEVEQVIRRKDLSGKEAFVQLFDELSSGLTYRFTLPEEDQERDVTGEELLALLYHADRELRHAAFATFLQRHAEQQLVLTSCFNNLLLDHGREADLRGYPDLLTPTCLTSETSPEMVEQMLSVTEANYPLAQRYFELKRRLLGYETMRNTDLYAPVAESSRTFSYEEAQALVLESFAGFATELAQRAERILHGGRVDVAPRPGKSGGAFCMGMTPEEEPFVLLNFTGTLRDVSTLAHELGHAVHYSCSGQQNLYHYHAPLPLAETASVFGEMLLTRHLLQQDDRHLRIALLCSKLEDMIATTFRQTVLTRFEQKAHQLRGERLLAADDYCRLWWDENARLFGSAVEMIDEYRWGWSYISHFIHARFYCFSYVFGELLVLALYRKYQEEGAGFVPGFLELLAAGGSAAPAELVQKLGLDLNDAAFWQNGYDVMDGMLDELEMLIAAGD
jgi:oligoendopeptidase F